MMRKLPRPARHRLPRAAHGVTLIEMLVGLAVLAVLTTLVAPSVQRMIEMQRLRGVAAQLVTDLQFARNEALSRGVTVRMSFKQDADNSCYVFYTSVGGKDAAGVDQVANDFVCDCLAGPGNACPPPAQLSGTTEIRTVLVPRSQSVQVAPTNPSYTRVGIEQAAGSLVSIDPRARGAGAFGIKTWIDTERALQIVVSPSGRPTVCRPTGSSMDVTPC